MFETIKNIPQLTQEGLNTALEFLYDKAVHGVTGMDTAEELALPYMTSGKTKEQQADALIRWQNAKCGASGFITGLGGVITLPVAIPANLVSVMYVQIRMIAAIAHIYGHDIKSDKVKTLIFLCLTGQAAMDILKDTGVQIGNKIALKLLKELPAKTLTEINKKVGFKLLTKFGNKGVINISKTIPLVGGIVGGTFDAISTNTIGNASKKVFSLES